MHKISCTRRNVRQPPLASQASLPCRDQEAAQTGRVSAEKTTCEIQLTRGPYRHNSIDDGYARSRCIIQAVRS